MPGRDGKCPAFQREFVGDCAVCHVSGFRHFRRREVVHGEDRALARQRRQPWDETGDFILNLLVPPTKDYARFPCLFRHTDESALALRRPCAPAAKTYHGEGLGASGGKFIEGRRRDRGVVGVHAQSPAAIKRRGGVEIDDGHFAEEARRQVPAAVRALDNVSGDGTMLRKKRRNPVRARLRHRHGHDVPAFRGGVSPDAGERHFLDALIWDRVEVEDRGGHRIPLL